MFNLELITADLVFFYSFATVLIVAAIKVVSAKNLVHAALFLVLAFVTASGIFLQLGAEFLAITLVLVYVGAVMVLFLFAIMMQDFARVNEPQMRRKNLPLALLVGGIILVEMIVILLFSKFDKKSLIDKVHFIDNHEDAVNAISNTKALGKLLYSEYLYAFEVAGIILLVTMIAAVMLTLRKRKDQKTQNIATQVQTKAEDRIRLIQNLGPDTHALD